MGSFPYIDCHTSRMKWNFTLEEVDKPVLQKADLKRLKRRDDERPHTSHPSVGVDAPTLSTSCLGSNTSVGITMTCLPFRMPLALYQIDAKGAWQNLS